MGVEEADIAVMTYLDLLYISQGAFTTTTRSASWRNAAGEGVTSIIKGESEVGLKFSKKSVT